MPEGKCRSLLRRSGPVGALGFVCLACLVPVSSAASAPAPDPPPPAVEPDPQPARPLVVAPRRPREAPPTVVQPPAVQNSPPAPVARSNPPALVDEPAVAKKPALRASPRPVRKRPAAKKAATVNRPAKVATSAGSAAHDVWQAPRAAVAVPQVEVLQRRRFALAGVALALVAVSGGVLLGVGRQTLMAVVE